MDGWLRCVGVEDELQRLERDRFGRDPAGMGDGPGILEAIRAVLGVQGRRGDRQGAPGLSECVARVEPVLLVPDNDVVRRANRAGAPGACAATSIVDCGRTKPSSSIGTLKYSVRRRP
jgi:hypothetical protein